MDITKSLTFYLDDPRRIEKLGVGTAVVLIRTILAPVLIGMVGFVILTGYAIRLLQNVRDGVEYPLPEWDRWSEDLSVGFKYVVAVLVYALPLMVLWIPTAVGAAMTDSSRGAGFVGVPLLVLGMCLITIYGIFLALASPGITIAFARDNEIRSAFDVSAIWEWTRAHVGPVIVATLVYLAASMVLAIGGSIVGALLCVVGLIVTVPLATLLTTVVQYHLYGQLAREYGAPVRNTTHVTPLLPLPDAPANPFVPASPSVAEELDAAGWADAPAAPEAPTAPEAHVTYVAPRSPADFDAASVAPDATDAPDAPDVPDVPDALVELAPDEALLTPPAALADDAGDGDASDDAVQI